MTALRSSVLALAAMASLSACTTNEYGERVPSRALKGGAIGAAGGAALGAIIGGNVAAGAALGAAAGAIVGAVEDDKNRYEDYRGRRYYYERNGRRYTYRDGRRVYENPY